MLHFIFVACHGWSRFQLPGLQVGQIGQTAVAINEERFVTSC